MPRRRSLLLAALLAAAFLTSAVEAQSPKPGRVRVEPNLTGQDPFAARAAKTNRPVLAPKTDENPRNQVERPTETAPKQDPPARSSASPTPRGADALYLVGEEPIQCVVQKLSGGSGLTAASVEGETKTYPLGSIERVELSVSDAFRRGVLAFESGRKLGAESEYAKALELFKEARQTSERRLEKEWATAKLVETYAALGRDDEAVDEFFILCRVDPYSAFLPSIPLRWVNQTTLARGSSPDAKRLAEANAEEWLNLEANPSKTFNPTGRLLAASLLMHSPKQSKNAIAALQALVTLEPPENAEPDAVETCRTISLLATAQLWRAAVLRKPTEKEVARWKQTIELLPGELRIGPQVLVAQGEKALGQDEDAARDFIKVSALGVDKFSLAEFAAKEAADAYERLGQKETARKIREDAQKRFAR